MKWQDHFTIPGYGDTVFQTDSKSTKEFAQAELVMEVPSYRRAATKQNKRQLTGKKQIADNDYEVTGLEGTSYRRIETKQNK
ncbi:MAG: hypothetical protein J5875_01635 [Paludibacteraceae bacterium]|nr:hypothetical protein [Paludibacteraceae bacterium]